MATQQPISILEYHQKTKHFLDHYAQGPGTLDWVDQPDPFRRFEGSTRFQLPLVGQVPSPAFSLLQQGEKIEVQAVSLQSLGLMLELAFGLSAWKQYGSDRWALRCNPSSGNLHPTEAYLINTATEDLPAGLYHYLSHDHVLEKRGEWNTSPEFQGLLIGLSSIHWREAWKYGERAFRYCQHDIGHALAALRYAAAIQGWSVEILAEVSDAAISGLLGLDREQDFLPKETESPDVLCRIHTGAFETVTVMDPRVLADLAVDHWFGKANRLSHYHHYQWPVVDEAALATLKPSTSEHCESRTSDHRLVLKPSPQPAVDIIRQRRSAQQFDAQTSISLVDFFQLLQALMPGRPMPFDLWPWSPKIHLFLFVHRVEGLPPGVYALPREPGYMVTLKDMMQDAFIWEPVDGTPDQMDLYCLLRADCRKAAKTLSCHQGIASDGAFSLAMAAEFGDELENEPWRYRRLFWESGLIGQALYLEAEAIGMRGTGIGCFFDDAVHEVLGITGSRFQSIYHFTVGKALEDKRLQTLPAYFHLNHAK
jgi:SagB-type dehydrogenase family enzyme